MFKAENGAALLRAQLRSIETESGLDRLPLLPINAAAAGEFKRLRENKKLRKNGRGDLLIAAIAPANRTTLMTRNSKDFGKVLKLHVENWVTWLGMVYAGRWRDRSSR